jgi:hypothetical protein
MQAMTRWTGGSASPPDRRIVRAAGTPAGRAAAARGAAPQTSLRAGSYATDLADRGQTMNSPILQKLGVSFFGFLLRRDVATIASL